MEENTYNLIENYLEGNLSGKELTIFEARLQSDPEFAKKVSLLEEVEDALSDPVRQNIQTQLNKLGATYFQKPALAKKKVKRLSFYLKPWGIAASFLLLVSIGFLFWQNQSRTSLSNAQIFAQNYQPPNMDETTRGQDSETALQEAIQLYKNQDYATALVQLKKLKQLDPENQKLTYLLAHTYLNLLPPQMTEASRAFKDLIQHKQNVYVPKAQWYLGLIYIQQNNLGSAKPLLQAVVTSNGSNSEKAKEILKHLND